MRWGIAAAVGLSAGFGAVGQSGLPGFGDEEAPSGDELVNFEVVAEHSPFNPSEGTTLALVYDVAEDWHIYWRNNGDTGMPPQFSFELPAGVTMGEPAWPAPKRYSSGGGFIMDYVLDGKVVLLVPLEVRDEFVESMIEAGTGELTIRVETEWLVCKDVCLPGSASREILVPFAATDGVARAETLFAGAREALPIEPDEASKGEVRAEFVDGVLRMEAPGAIELTFFPEESDAGVAPLEEKADCMTRGAKLAVPYSAEASEAERIRGVLRVRYAEKSLGRGEEVAVRIDVPGPAAKADKEDRKNRERR